MITELADKAILQVVNHWPGAMGHLPEAAVKDAVVEIKCFKLPETV